MLLYLVRHAAVTVRPEEPARRWHLSQEGRAAADALSSAHPWPDLSIIYTSAEPKAIATAQRIAAPHGLPVSIERDLREVSRPATMYNDYPAVVRRYLAGAGMEGWEPRVEAQRRVRLCVDAIVARHRDGDVAIVSHGLALTLYLSDALSLAEDAAVNLWSSARFPDVAIVDPEAKRLLRMFGRDDYSQGLFQQNSTTRCSCASSGRSASSKSCVID